MKKLILPSQKYLKFLFLYDAETGKLTWKNPKANRVKRGDIAGCMDKTTGYINVYINGQKFKSHRVIWKLFYGFEPQDEIDHINGDRADNRLSNIRPVSGRENMKNKKIYKNNKSGFSGVNWCKIYKKWKAQGVVGGKRKNLGSFDSKADAIEAVKLFRKAEGYFPLHGTKGAVRDD